MGTSLVTACGDDSDTGGGGSGPTTSATGMTTTSTGTTSATSATGATSSTATGSGGAPVGDPLFVAVGYGGRRISSPDGITWSNDVIVDPAGGDDNNLFRGIGFVGGQWVAVGGSSAGQIATSPNGKDWTFQTPGTAWLADVVELGGTLITAGGNGLRQRSVDGGVTWTDQAPYYAGHFRAIAAGNGVAVAVGHTYGMNVDHGLISTTTDGANWSPESVDDGPPFGSIVFGDGIFVAAGDDRCWLSNDAHNWSDCTGVTGGNLDRVVFVNGEFLIGNPSGYFHSTGGARFTHTDSQHHPVSAYGQGLYVALEWPDHIFTSPDLSTWTEQTHDPGPAFVEVVLGHLPP